MEPWTWLAVLGRVVLSWVSKHDLSRVMLRFPLRIVWLARRLWSMKTLHSLGQRTREKKNSWTDSRWWSKLGFQLFPLYRASRAVRGCFFYSSLGGTVVHPVRLSKTVMGFQLKIRKGLAQQRLSVGLFSLVVLTLNRWCTMIGLPMEVHQEPCEQLTPLSILVNLHVFVVIDAVQDSEKGKDGIVRFAYIGPRQHGKLQHLILFFCFFFFFRLSESLWDNDPRKDRDRITGDHAIGLLAYPSRGSLSRYLGILLSIGHRSMIINLTETGPFIQVLTFLQWQELRLDIWPYPKAIWQAWAIMGVSDTKLRPQTTRPLPAANWSSECHEIVHPWNERVERFATMAAVKPWSRCTCKHMSWSYENVHLPSCRWVRQVDWTPPAPGVCNHGHRSNIYLWDVHLDSFSNFCGPTFVHTL